MAVVRRLLVPGLLVALHLATRLYRLDVLPAFVDENLHTSWALAIARGEQILRPWDNGKGLPVFVNAALVGLLPSSGLWAARAVTVLFGVATLLGLWGVALRLLGPRTAVVAGVLYALCPFTLFYDRLVLTDPMMCVFSTLALLASVTLAQRKTRACAGLAAAALALTVVSKALGLLWFFVPAAAWLALARPLRRRAGLLLWTYAGALALLALPLWRFLEVTTAIRMAVGPDDGGAPARVLANSLLAAGWFWAWMTPPLAVLAGIGAVMAVLRREPPGLLLAATWLLPTAALAATATTWYPRYLLAACVPALILAAHVVATLGTLAARAGGVPVVAGATLLSLVPALQMDVALWLDPRRLALPAIERMQFVDGWPSGYGVQETVAFVRDELRLQPRGLVVVLWSHVRLTTPLALRVALRHERGLELQDLPFDGPRSVALLEEWSRSRRTLVVVSQPRGERARPTPADWAPLDSRRVLTTWKPNGEICDEVYRLGSD